jgi:hypothetical protein
VLSVGVVRVWVWTVVVETSSDAAACRRASSIALTRALTCDASFTLTTDWGELTGKVGLLTAYAGTPETCPKSYQKWQLIYDGSYKSGILLQQTQPTRLERD